jgi:lysophospholipase L1-like esterase
MKEITMPERRGVLRVLRLVAANILAMILLLLLVEALVRLGHPEIAPAGTTRILAADSVYGASPALQPLSNGWSEGERVAVDALGFWKYSVPSDSVQEGWLLLGDSVTMGPGVEPDSTFAGRLAATSPGWKILNPSWLGYSSADYVNVATALLRRSQARRSSLPEIRRVTLFWTLNDVYSHCAIGLPPGETVRASGSVFLTWIRQHYRTYFWLKALLFDRPKTYFEFDRQFYRRSDPRFLAASSDLDSLQRLCRGARVDFRIVLLPYEYQLRRNDSAAFHPQRLLSRELDSLGIRWYDSAPALMSSGENPRSLYRFGDGIHLSAAGHRELFRYLHWIFWESR